MKAKPENKQPHKPAAQPYTAWLSGTPPGGALGEWGLEQDEFLIGREPTADLSVSLPSISRRHALIRRVQHAYYLADLGSRNGTFLNGEKVGTEPQSMQDGDEIVLGGVLELRFHDLGDTLASPLIGRLHGIWIDEVSHAVWVDARQVEPPLSPAQYELMNLLYHSAGKVVSRSEIISAVWPGANPAGISEEAIDGLIKRLRLRLRETQPAQEYVEVLRGHGLRLRQPGP